MTNFKADAKIVGMELAHFEAKRPRTAGCNARLGVHGETVHLPLVRLTTDDGTTGFGRSRVEPNQLKPLVGAPLSALFVDEHGVTDLGSPIEYPLWDLIGQRHQKPVYALTAEIVGREVPASVQVPCYDTSLYIDDLHLDSDEAAAALIAEEARFGYDQGHRAFKVKVGRGGRHMPVMEGTTRDIAVIHAVREMVGVEAPIMIDANNGYTLNLAKTVLTETAACTLFWLEEAFHEDGILYEDLQEWLKKQGLTTLVADGEGDASPQLLTWAEAGLIDVVQYDIFSHGFTTWLHLGQQLDGWGVRAAPHHYGALYGNYAAGHLLPAVPNFTYVEWDEAQTPVLDTSAYSISEGFVNIPNLPGFGLMLDEERFRHAVKTGGVSFPG